MLQGKDIICISSIDWNFIWQGHQEIMSTFARNGNRVIFIENTGARAPGIRDIGRIRNRIRNWRSGIKGIRREMENLYVYSPLVMPFPYLRLARWLNRRTILATLDKWIRAMDFRDPVIWVFLPTPLTLDIIANCDSSLVVYYCIDNFMVSSKAAAKIRDSEIKLISIADLVFVTSRELYRHCEPYNGKVHIFPFAVNFEAFENKRKTHVRVPDELVNMKKPVIGYIGGVHKWIDFGLIRIAAERLSGYSFVMVGPLQTDISLLEGLDNVHFLGKKEHASIPDFINGFDVCIIPYLLTEYTKNVYPTKLNEYLAMGKPVISTDLPEVAYFNAENDNAVSIAYTADEFCDFLIRALQANTAQDIERRIAIARNNSWSARIEQMSGLMDDVMQAKQAPSVDWRVKFQKICRSAEKKIFSAALIFLSVYLVVFYTPVVWWLAEPLKISEPPAQADAIVVLAGGVGESGLPGQGYEERVGYAVELYHKGYAPLLIFSSGYMYAFKEPLVMKALAQSLGARPESIILEDEAKSTYEHAVNIHRILASRKISRILMVSSPYHMLRLSLVLKKNAPETEVIYTPVADSLFYQRPRGPQGDYHIRQIEWKQAKAILHEYAGILYYWLRSRI
ncbi:MAG TPA: ElyC/SanA/YdcF family protein [Candidatus Omnitrophota bacterium]|nr:ElyC/SanA/YdcF family protein [Candidatus Omnitrophota bacterium]